MKSDAAGAIDRLDRPLRRKLLKGALGGLLLPALVSPVLVACLDGGGNADVVVPPTPILPSVNNFRDIAGADDANAYRTSSGRKLRRGLFYRSNALAPSATDLATLNTLGIRAVYDLRTPDEIGRKADVRLAGSTYQEINILGTSDAAIAPMTSAAATVAMMEAAERQFVTDAGMRSRIAQVLAALATTDGSQLFHCSGGKDRTGWVAAVLLSLADVPRSVIVQDYLLTNTYSSATIQATYAAWLAAYGQAFADTYYPTLGAQESFLVAGFDQASATYGSMGSYIADGLGLDAATQTGLRDKLLA